MPVSGANSAYLAKVYRYIQQRGDRPTYPKPTPDQLGVKLLKAAYTKNGDYLSPKG